MVPAAVTPNALVPFPYITPLAVNVPAPVPPFATVKSLMSVNVFMVVPVLVTVISSVPLSWTANLPADPVAILMRKFESVAVSANKKLTSRALVSVTVLPASYASCRVTAPPAPEPLLQLLKLQPPVPFVLRHCPLLPSAAGKVYVRSLETLPERSVVV